MIRTFIKLFSLPLAFAAAISLSTDVFAQGQGAPKRSIVQVKGDVYMFKNNFHNAMFVVTSDGIVVTDPINADAVEWLKAELKKRFNKPVTTMIYSHFHSDHNSGGEAWGPGLDVFAHEKTKGHVAAGRTKTALPTRTFANEMVFRIGGKTFELTYLGVGHSDDLIATVVRPENVAFVVDAVAPKRLPFRDFPRTDVQGMINQIKAIEALNFDVMLPGHGPVGTHADAKAGRVYVEKLVAEVKAVLSSGKSVDDAVKMVTMDEYKSWQAYKNWRALNIQGVARWLKEKGMI